MPTAHNEAKLGDISNIVIMPGDPLRAKMIAEKYLEDAKCVNSVRGIYAYTGFYKDKRITVMGHGMGMPSIGIYAYELFKFYNVDTIIRIGSCGTHNKNIKIGDTVIATKVNTESNFALQMFEEDIHELDVFDGLNFIIEDTAKKNNIKLVESEVTSSEVFDVYFDHIRNNPKYKILEMEAFALFLIAHKLKKECACLLTVVDSTFEDIEVSSEDRETKLNDMILVALESTLQL